MGIGSLRNIRSLLAPSRIHRLTKPGCSAAYPTISFGERTAIKVRAISALTQQQCFSYTQPCISASS